MPQNASTPAAVADVPPAPVALPRRQPQGKDPEAAIKSLAKTIAQDTTGPIPDRHVRAEVRTRVYNQLAAVLRQLEERQAAQRAREQRTRTVLGAIIAALATALGISLLV